MGSLTFYGYTDLEKHFDTDPITTSFTEHATVLCDGYDHVYRKASKLAEEMRSKSRHSPRLESALESLNKHRVDFVRQKGNPREHVIYNHLSQFLGVIPTRHIVITTADDYTTASLFASLSLHLRGNCYRLFENEKRQAVYDREGDILKKWESNGNIVMNSSSLLVTTAGVASNLKLSALPFDVGVINFDTNSSLGIDESEQVIKFRTHNQHVKYLNEQEEVIDGVRRRFTCYLDSAATTIFCWWRRTQLKGYFEKHRAARIIQLWNRRCMFRIRCKRRSIITRRRQLKLEAAASSSPLRDRGQPLPPINHRQRYRRNQRARRQRNSKRSRRSRKRGQHRGRPPNQTQPQQSQQQSIKRRENELGIALSNSGRLSIRGSVIGSVHNNSSELKTAGPYVLGRDLRRRDSNGRVTALGTALQSSELSSKESVIGKTLHGNESSSRGNTAETPQQDSSESHRSSTQPISSLKSKSSRRRRRRRRRRKHPRTTHHQKDEASTSKRHTPTYPSSDAHLSNISDLCDGIRRQLHQASSSDRNLLKFVCQLVLQTIDNQPTEPSIIDKIESPSTSTSVNNNPSSTTNNESFSSIKNVDSHTPKSTTTTKLTELPCSVSITTEETTARHEKPVTYLHALIGTTSNFG